MHSLLFNIDCAHSKVNYSIKESTVFPLPFSHYFLCILYLPADYFLHASSLYELSYFYQRQIEEQREEFNKIIFVFVPSVFLSPPAHRRRTYWERITPSQAKHPAKNWNIR